MKCFRVFFAVVFSAVCLSSVKAETTRIAFGSCASQERPQPIWAEINKLEPELFLLIGDNIYGDTQDMSVLRAKYAKLDAMPGFQELRSKTRLLGIWDDHDYGANNAGFEYPMKKESQQVFLDFFRVPQDSPRRKQEGIYYSETFGKPGQRVQLILLDTRYFRSPVLVEKDPVSGRTFPIPNTNLTSTILGTAQWKWLEEQLRKPAELRLIASGIQVVPQDTHAEKWMDFPHERERLFRTIKETGANGVMFLTGDRHFGELSVINTEVGYPLIDMTSSGLNQGRKEWRNFEPNRHRMGTMNYGDNFGLIEVDWDRSNVSLKILDDVGDVRISQKLPLSLLTIPVKK